MVDLQNQYLQIKPEIDQAIAEVLQKADFINGSAVNTFEKSLQEYLQCNHVIACANGTDALQIALMALDLPTDSEIIIPSFGYVAAAEVVALLGYKIIFADVNEHDFNLDTDKLESLITPKTSAIIPIHLFGQACNMLAILKIAQKYNLYIIEDNAQSIGSDYFFPDGTKKKLGTIGHIGTTSFFPSKNLGCFGDGGAIFTQDHDLASKMRMIASHGQKTKYMHEIVGVNSRLDTLQAAILNVKLKKLDVYIEARQKAAHLYYNHLSSVLEIELPMRNDFSNHVFHQFCIKIKNGKRDELKNFLSENQIPSMIYYPAPLNEQAAFEKYRVSSYSNISTSLCSKILALPMHTELDEGQILFICEKIARFFAI